MESQRSSTFKVDLAGLIEIMGTSLYSRVDTPIRELIQNAHDAIVRRRQRDLTFQGRIDVLTDANQKSISFVDDGIGLSMQEADDYLGTLGLGLTGLIRKGTSVANEPPNDTQALIGQFGVGLFSAFMLADRITVESLKLGEASAIFWEATSSGEIHLQSSDRTNPGTKVTLFLKPEHHQLAANETQIEAAIKEYADFVSIPIFLNESKSRINVINVAWFDPTPDLDEIELALESYFGETPLDVLPIHIESPVAISGALYVTPQRTPGFADDSVVTVTIRRMVISRRVQGLLPNWASFMRGVLELSDSLPTTSREDLVRNIEFLQAQQMLESLLYSHFEYLASNNRSKWDALLAWHRYTLAGTALFDARLRAILYRTYQFPTSKGQMSMEQILEQSSADPLAESEAEKVVWYNSDRRQERWVNELFSHSDVPCVHALRNFEESLLSAFVADLQSEEYPIALRIASPSAPNFAQSILGILDLEDAEKKWQDFFSHTQAKVMVGSFASKQPVIAFLNERVDLTRTMDDLKKEGQVPSGFQRLIDRHFEAKTVGQNEIILNTNHRLVARALSQTTNSPLASILRLLVYQALTAAGGSVPDEARRDQIQDLDWLTEVLWGKD